LTDLESLGMAVYPGLEVVRSCISMRMLSGTKGWPWRISQPPPSALYSEITACLVLCEPARSQPLWRRPVASRDRSIIVAQECRFPWARGSGRVRTFMQCRNL